jgi:hypothetical protein
MNVLLVRSEKIKISRTIHKLDFLEFMIVAGFRPGSRGPFVSAKGPKTSDAPSGLIKMGRTLDWGGRTNSLRSNKVRRFMRASDPRTGRKASINGEKAQIRKPLKIIGLTIVKTRREEEASHWGSNFRVSVMFCVAGFRPGRPRPFCFGKRTQNHVGRGVALRVPCAVRQPRQRANSLRSNTARLFSGVGCTARPPNQAREDY